MRKSIIVASLVVGFLAVLGYGMATSDSTPTGTGPARVGGIASDFSIKLFSGDNFTLSEQRGKVVLVNFWASWCPPCKDEAPALERAWKTYKDRGLVMVGLALWDNEPDARAFLQTYGITFPTGPDPTGDIAIKYGVTGVPETFFLNREGKLIRRWIGPLTEQQISTYIEEALRSTP